MENPPRVIRYRDYPVTPWKNGLGVTRDVVAPTPGIDGREFGWRLSMAEIGQDSPFSSYPGIERQLAVVAGGELELVIEGAKHRLRTGDPAVTFSGDARVSGRPIGDPVTDLNLMLDRDAFAGSLEPVGAGMVAVDFGCVILVALVPVQVRHDVEGKWELGVLDAFVASVDASVDERTTFQLVAGSAAAASSLAFAVRVRPSVSVR
jgi:environmental stress-induced protein Ves